MMLVRDMAVRQDHAVLTVRVDGRWLVLDNRYSRLSETRDLPHFMPLFAIDHKGVSLFAAPYAARPHHESETDMLPAAESGRLRRGALPCRWRSEIVRQHNVDNRPDIDVLLRFAILYFHASWALNALGGEVDEGLRCASSTRCWVC